MPFMSPFQIDIPQTNILTYLFPPDQTLPDTPNWIDAQNNSLSLSIRQMYQWSKRLAVGLDRLGVRPGEVVLIYSPNHIYVPAAYLGVVGSERIFSGMNPLYTLPEVVYQLKDTGAQAILVHPLFIDNAIAAAKQVGLSVDRVFLFADTPQATVDNVRDWRDMLGSAEEADRYQVKPLSPGDSQKIIATVNYSSGTTGLPKGVCISHSALIANVAQTKFMQYSHLPEGVRDYPPERWVGFLPLYHAFGQLYSIGMSTKIHVPIYIMKQFVLPDFLKIIETKRITTLQLVPPILVMLAKRPEVSDYDLSSLKKAICGAAPLSKELQNEVSRRCGMTIVQGWGMTEVTCGATIVPGSYDNVSGSVGLPYANTEVKLLGDDGKEVGADAPGEVYVRGPQLCLGYWKNETATKDALDSEGWLKTGDIAIRNKEGWFWIIDRKKELIKVNGLQVAPAELEAVLLTHPEVDDVAVVGVTVQNDEYPRAYVVLKENSKHVTEASIKDWMKQRVAKHKQLTGGIAFIDVVPKLASGKITRKTMREWAKRDVVVVQGKVKARL